MKRKITQKIISGERLEEICSDIDMHIMRKGNMVYLRDSYYEYTLQQLDNPVKEQYKLLNARQYQK